MQSSSTRAEQRERERSVRTIEKQDLDQLRRVTIISVETIFVSYEQPRDNEGYLSIPYTLWRVDTRVILQYLLLDSIFNSSGFGTTRIRVRGNDSRLYTERFWCNYTRLRCLDDFRGLLPVGELALAPPLLFSLVRRSPPLEHRSPHSNLILA